MSSNKMANYLVTIEHLDSEKIGSGVMFASHDRSSHYYVLTAKHNFKEGLTDPSQLGSLDLEILFQKRAKITTSGLKVYFPSEQDDLALIIFKSEETEILKNVKSLKIYNSDPETDYKNSFVVIGYPKRTSNSDFAQPHDNIFARINSYDEDTRLEILKDEGASTTHAIKDGTDYYTGMSGGGVFFEDQYKELQLRSIIKQYSADYFSCVRLDQLVDEINSSIQQYPEKLDKIEVGHLLFAGDEPIEIDEISDFEFFKSNINDRLKSPDLWLRYGISEFQQKDYNIDKEKLQGIAKKLRDRRDRIRRETDELSDLFAYIAIASHSNKDYRLSSSYFFEATRLNPKHTQTLLLEKHNRKDKINDIEATSLANLERKIEFLLAKEQQDDLAARRVILIEGLAVARTFKEEQGSPVIGKFEEKLIENYKRDSSLRDHYKYKELGDYFYNTRPNSEELPDRAFRFHTVSLKVAKLSSQTEQTVNFIRGLQRTYNNLYDELYLRDHQEIITESAQEAVDMILADEDPGTKHMLVRMSEEIDDLKTLSFNQRKNSKEQVRILSSIGLDIGSQAEKTHQNTAKLNEVNESVADTLEQAKSSTHVINLINTTTKGVSSQLLRVEDSALKLAQELASKLEPRSNITDSERGGFSQWFTVTPRCLFFFLSVGLILTLLPWERAL